MKNTPQECAKTSAFTFRACHFRLVHFGSAGATRSLPLTLGFCKDYFVINDFEKQLISVVKIQCIPHPFCNMDLPIIKHSCNIRIKTLSSYSWNQATINSAVNRCSGFWGSAPLFFLQSINDFCWAYFFLELALQCAEPAQEK